MADFYLVPRGTDYVIIMTNLLSYSNHIFMDSVQEGVSFFAVPMQLQTVDCIAPSTY